MAVSRGWVVITGGGTGIGRALAHHFAAKGCPVLACGRRLQPLEDMKASAPAPGRVAIVACDIGTREGRVALVDKFAHLSDKPRVELLVQNAAIGDPGPLDTMSIDHFEETLRANVVAPLALTQAFLPALQRSAAQDTRGGRILHLGTGVAHEAQASTCAYGVSKMAFHRLYQQINADALGGVRAASLSPGMVDTEGVRDHVAKARALALPHVRFFDEAFANGWATPEGDLMAFVDAVLALDSDAFGAREWRYAEWRVAGARMFDGGGGGANGGGGVSSAL
jgi:NAD(P)-dependent dehydrogenase (short-subunit alcohol dehydrogenase family)